MTRLELHSTDTAHHITVQGNLDLAGSNAVRASLIATVTAAPRETVLDLSQVRLLTSAGIRVLVEAAKILRAAGTRLVLRNPQEFVSGALALAGLDSLLTVVTEPPFPA